jgi:CubicO group peptidase (beta-lactamase class C family)
VTSLDEAVAQIDDWEPDVVAVGVRTADGAATTRGPTDRALALASVTKPLTAYATLIAARDGLLHLDEPVGPVEGATVRHLLAHAGGLPMDRAGIRGVPGRRRVYSNWGYDLLGDRVAERAGMPFADYLDVEVLQPLGMTATTLDGSPAKDGVGTVDDLLAFVVELLAPQLLDEELHAAATSVAFPDLDGVLPGFGRQTPNDWGLGFEIRGHKDPHWTAAALSPTTYGHFGQSGSFLWVDPERAVGCVSLADRNFGDWARRRWPALGDAVIAALG